MMGVLLLPVMAALGISLWIKRRRASKELEKTADNDDNEDI